MNADGNYITVLLLVRGMVQGVGFRYWTRVKATELVLGGHVKNLPDGSVEVLISGSPHAVEAMLQIMVSGPAHALVEELEVVEKHETDEPVKGFKIIR